MAILTICNHKGGTGKTTSSVDLAAAFGLMGHRVLVLDLDPQGFLTRTLGVDEPPREASSLALLDPAGDLLAWRDLIPGGTTTLEFSLPLGASGQVVARVAYDNGEVWGFSAEL